MNNNENKSVLKAIDNTKHLKKEFSCVAHGFHLADELLHAFCCDGVGATYGVVLYLSEIVLSVVAVEDDITDL